MGSPFIRLYRTPHDVDVEWTEHEDAVSSGSEKVSKLEAIKRWLAGLPGLPGHILRFSIRVVLRFFGKKNGLILAGALAYNTLLSLVPLLAVILIFFSVFKDKEQLLETMKAELELIVPGQADAIGTVLVDFADQMEVIGIIGLAVLLFFSSIAFRILENAMTEIFDMPAEKKSRSFWVSALIPYLFICLMGLGIVAVTAGTSFLDAIPTEAFEIPILGWEISIDATRSAAFYISGVLGLILLFTAVYVVMPLQKVALSRALVGGLTATVLWELVRHFLVWYFTHISLVNIVYGSLATVIIVLLSMEVAALILLLGAQVIAELERAARADVPWHQGPILARNREENGHDGTAHQKDAERNTVRTHRRLRDEP